MQQNNISKFVSQSINKVYKNTKAQSSSHKYLYTFIHTNKKIDTILIAIRIFVFTAGIYSIMLIKPGESFLQILRIDFGTPVLF